MKRRLARALRLLLAVLVLAAMPTPGRAATSAHLLIRSIPAGVLPDALVLDTATHRLFVANTGPQVMAASPGYGPPDEAYRSSPGSVSVIDTNANHVVATVPIDVWPLQMVLDARRQRLYVLCADALPIHVSRASGLPAPMKPTLDIIDARTLRLLARWRVPGFLPLDPSLPFYPPQVLTFDPTSDHLFVQAFDQSGLSKPARIAAYLYDAATLRLLHTYPAPPPSLTTAFFAVQSPSTPVLMDVESRSPTKTSTTSVLVGHPRLIQLASGVSISLRDVTLSRSWGGPLPYYGTGWSPEIRDLYATSTASRLLMLVAYSALRSDNGPPYALGVYNLQTGTMLRQLVFAAGAAGGQQAVAFDERLGRYYVLGTAPNPRHPEPCAAAINIVTGDLGTGKIVHTTPGMDWLTVALADPVRHLVYAASGDGVEEGPLERCAILPGTTRPRAFAGVLQVIDGRTGATLATASPPRYSMAQKGAPPVQEPGQVVAMVLDPATGTVYAADGRGGNAIYVISLVHP